MTLARGSRAPAHWLRLFVTVIALLGVLSVDLSRATTSFAKEFDVIGAVDCGERSGKRCSFDDTLTLLTDSVTGELTRVKLDIRWVKDDLPTLDQDDEITLAVESLADGTLRVIGITSARKRDGTESQGLIAANGKSQSTSSRSRLQDDDTNTGRFIPATGIGGVSGTVRSIFTLQPIQGAVIRIGTQSAVTDAAGSYSLQGVDGGSVTVEASAGGFVAQSQQVTVAAGSSATASFDLSQNLPNIVLTLVWGATPTDLDAHLSGPASGGGRFHLFFVNRNPETYATMTDDSQTGFGPERIIIRRDAGTNQYAPGEYRFWVHNFTGTPEFNQSQARVVVTKDSQFVSAFNVGNGSGDASEELWHVVNLQVTAAGDVTTSAVQQFTNGDGLTILRPPYGAKPR